MNREKTIEAIFQSLEALTRAAASRKLDQVRFGLPTHAQIGVMLVLEHAGPQSIKDLAAKFRMTSSAATQLVDGLVKEGLLKRTEDARDRRKICLETTPKGRAISAKAQKCRMENMTAMFSVLTEEELSQLEKIQRKLVEHLQQLWTKNHNLQ